mgnify:CR=1 FL=1|jgi:hypothetical protein
MMKIRKPIKRRIKRKKPGTGSSNVYFTEDTQNAIIEWQTHLIPLDQEKIFTDIEKLKKKELREIIYHERIHPAFDALVDNLINVYDYKANLESKEDLKKECLSFLFQTIGKYDYTKSFRAFSYFNVIAKNWLTIRCKNAAKNNSRMVSIDNPDAWADSDYELILDTKTADAFDDFFNPRVTKEQLKSTILSVRGMLRSDNHKKVLDAVLEILDQKDDLDFLNKRAISCYLRELTSLSQKEISTALSAIKKKYKTYKNIKESTV